MSKVVMAALHLRNYSLRRCRLQMGFIHHSRSAFLYDEHPINVRVYPYTASCSKSGSKFRPKFGPLGLKAGEPYILIIMEQDERGKVGKTVKWAFVAVLVVVAAVIGLFTIFRTHAAQAAVERAFEMVEKGDAEGLMEYVDPQGELGRLWEKNAKGMRDIVLDLLEQYRLEFSSLSFATRAEGEAAEVELRGGRLTIYSSDGEGPPSGFIDLGDSGLVFYVEKKSGSWLIEGVNYDVTELISEDGFLPF